jgi:hypothetical protein
MTRSRSISIALTLACALLVASCATSINRVLADPSRYRTQDVTVSGRVVDSFSVADRGAYRIEDDGASLWVVSDRGVPRTGAKVRVEGTIKEGFNVDAFGGRIKLPSGLSSGIVLIERSHRAK